MLCGYEESEGCFALPRSLSSHNIEGGNKTMALNQLAFYNCWRCAWAYEDASFIHTPYLNVHISVQSCVIFTLRVGWGWGARFEPYLKLKRPAKCFNSWGHWPGPGSAWGPRSCPWRSCPGRRCCTRRRRRQHRSGSSVSRTSWALKLKIRTWIVTVVLKSQSHVLFNWFDIGPGLVRECFLLGLPQSNIYV